MNVEFAMVNQMMEGIKEKVEQLKNGEPLP